MRLALGASVLMLTLAGISVAQEQRTIVEDALKAAEAERQRDAGKVEQMSEEAAAAVTGAPSGAEAIGSTATPAGTALPGSDVGLSLRRLLDAPLHDREGATVGTIRDVLLGSDRNAGIILVALADGSIRGLNAARIAQVLDQDAYRTDLARDSLAELPAYREEGGTWRITD
jgi:hypothetical protein